MRSLRVPPLVSWRPLLAAPVLAADPGAPATPVKPVTDTYHGVDVVDPYRWLEDADDPAVQAWSDAQNVRTRAYLDGLGERKPIKAELTRLISATSPAYYGMRRARIEVLRGHGEQAAKAAADADGDGALSADPDTAKIVIDPNALNPKGTTAIDWFVPSPDGRLVAVSLSDGGSENGTLHIFTVATGKELADPIPNVQYPTAGGSKAWKGDSTGFWYTRYPTVGPEQDRHFYQQVYFHALGTQPDKDRLSLGKDFPNPKVAEVALDNHFDPNGLLAIVENGDGGQYVLYAMTPDGKWTRVARYEDHVIAAAFGPDHALYLVSRRDAPHSKILKLPPGDLDIAHAKLIVPESDGTIQPVAEGGELPFAIAGDRLYVRELIGGPSRVDIFTLDGKKVGTLPLPDVAAVDEVESAGGSSVLFSVATYLRPPYFARYRRQAPGKVTETKLVETSPIKFDDAEIVRDFTASKDGTKIPINIIRRKGTQAGRQEPDFALRLWRLRRLARRRVSSGPTGACGWTAAASMPSPISAAAASMARNGTARVRSPTSRTCSTISSPRPSIWSRWAIRRPNIWRSSAPATAGC